MTASLVVVVLLWILAAGFALAMAFRQEILRAWREPVLRAPVMVIESDDWGYGPAVQAERLREIASALRRHRDGAGRSAVMTLGVVLAGPDTRRIAAEDCAVYHRLLLSDPALETVRDAMAVGAREGVFSLQLHGMEHFWPPTLLAAAKRDAAVRSWLTSAELPETEALPPCLQSRWIDGQTLPSTKLANDSMQGAALDEARTFRTVLGRPPEVVVPPTFIWPVEVERAWALAGSKVVITPGRRYDGRGASGEPLPSGRHFFNSEQSRDGLIYLVRDVYFEPARGHTAASALASVAAKTRLGMPTLIETHRSNFLGDRETKGGSLAELERLLSIAPARWPDLRFMSSMELANHYAAQSSLLERRLLPRLHCFLLRLGQVRRLRKLAWGTGVALPVALFCLMTTSSRTRVAA